VRQALVNTLEDDRGRWILSGDHREARNEFMLSGLYRGRPVNAIIDRTFVDAGGTRWVIDYKTSRHEGADLDAFLQQELERYAEPLARYRTLLSALHPVPVKTALYYPLLRGWICGEQTI
jgi:ATP-dependent exoDNAse (exonuclease V) beta subunit